MQADLERFWARLLTEPDFRARFVADPAGLAAQHGLSPEERDAVARTPMRDLHTAARSYAAKNAGKPARSSEPWWRRWLLSIPTHRSFPRQRESRLNDE